MKFSSSSPRLAAVLSVLVLFVSVFSSSSPYLPNQIHLSYGDGSNGDISSNMGVTWMTEELVQNPVIFYGSQGNPFQTQTQVVSTNWLKKQGYSYFGSIPTPNPDTIYQYRVCGTTPSNSLLCSDTFSFRSHPQSTRESFKFLVIGDMGVDKSEHTVSQLKSAAESGEYEFLFHVGDISYANDHPSVFYDTWNTYMNTVQPIATTLPYMTCPGNHEQPWPVGPPGQDFVPYIHRFNMPLKDVSKNFFYSFDVGHVHFVSLSTEAGYPNSPKTTFQLEGQLEFLEKDLAAAQKAGKWIIGFGHRGIYSSVDKASNQSGFPINEYIYIQQFFEPLFHKYGVNLYVAGHVHDYEVIYPTYQSNQIDFSFKNPDFTAYMITGCAGNVQKHETKHQRTVPPRWTYFRDYEHYGYNVFTVANSTSIHVEFHESKTNAVLNDFWLTR